jgi:hypothetical protein
MRKVALGLSLGIVWGLAVLVATIWATIGGHGLTLSKLDGYYPGYNVSYVGALIGFCWAFVTGFIAGILIASFYNLFSAETTKTS